MSKTCEIEWCKRGTRTHVLCLYHRPRTPLKTYSRPKQQSNKEIAYQTWKEEIARPWLIERYGNLCTCCGRGAHLNEKLDIDHIKSKGSSPRDKADLLNLQFLCRPCHHMKTIRKECLHEKDY